jgi:hypothetical protein
MTAKSQLVGHAKDTCGLMRPRFGPGQLLRDDDLRQGVDYTRDLSRLLFRSFFGCGVVCGLEVKATFACDVLTVEIAEGLALDCKGDPVHVCAKKTIVVDPRCTSVALNPPLWVVLRGTEKCCAPRQAASCDAGDGDSTTQCTREVDGFEMRVVTELSGCECGCPDGTNQWHKDACQCADPVAKCYQAHYEGKCGCSCGDCSDCDCDWILLARLDLDKNKVWTAYFDCRRFIRPVLIADPLTKPPDATETSKQDIEERYALLQKKYEELEASTAELRKAKQDAARLEQSDERKKEGKTKGSA